MKKTACLLALALACALCTASIAWADETGPLDENGKWVSGTYVGGTGFIDQAHPGMTATAVASFSHETPKGDEYISHSVTYRWYVSEDGEGWNYLSGALNYRVPDVGEEGYDEVVGRYLMCEIESSYMVLPAYTASGDYERLTYKAHSESYYVAPHSTEGDDATTWLSDGAQHWHACTSGSEFGCSYRLDSAGCAESTDVWLYDETTHWKGCSVCGTISLMGRHDFTEFLNEHLSGGYVGLLPETVSPVCSGCGQAIEMPFSFFVSEYLSGYIQGEAPEGGEEGGEAESAPSGDADAPGALAPTGDGAYAVPVATISAIALSLLVISLIALRKGRQGIALEK